MGKGEKIAAAVRRVTPVQVRRGKSPFRHQSEDLKRPMGWESVSTSRLVKLGPFSDSSPSLLRLPVGGSTSACRYVRLLLFLCRRALELLALTLSLLSSPLFCRLELLWIGLYPLWATPAKKNNPFSFSQTRWRGKKNVLIGEKSKSNLPLPRLLLPLSETQLRAPHHVGISLTQKSGFFSPLNFLVKSI